jgi:prevent-host-death family protein
MKKAKVSELKAHLSSYLAEIRNGESLLICDRATPIARLIPCDEDSEDLRIREARQPISALSSVRPVKLRKKLDADRILLESRGGP